MKKTYIKVIAIIVTILLIITVGVFLYNKLDKKDGSTMAKNDNIVVLNATNDANVDMVDRYANLTSEEIDKLMSERTLDKVSIEIEEGTLTNKGATIVIKDYNELPYSYGEYYHIEKLTNGEWKELKSIDHNINDIGHVIGRDGQTTIDFNWEKAYGKLNPGKYKFVMEIEYDIPKVSTEFEIK